MRPVAAWAVLILLLAASIGAFFAPWQALVIGLAIGVGALTRGRLGMLLFAAFTVGLNAVLLAWTTNGTDWINGATGGLRVATVVAINVGILHRVGVATWLEGLHLPRRAATFLGALFIAMHDIGRDAQSLRDAQIMTGQWPVTRIARIRSWALLVTPLLVLAVRRARIRRDALHLAGVATSSWFVPVVGLTALAMAGRLALVAVPNVSLVFVVAFVGGLAFGPRIGAASAALGMFLSDIVLSGFLPTGLVNIPAMAFVGLLGGAMRNLDFSDGAGKVIAWSLGAFATFAFSVLADGTEWLFVPEFRGDWEFLRLRLAAGLTFNVIPAVANGLLFALVAGPVQAAFKTPRPDLAESPPSPTVASVHP